MASLFSSGRGSLASFAVRPVASPDPATEMQRLLNQHATALLSLENEAVAIRGKQVSLGQMEKAQRTLPIAHLPAAHHRFLPLQAAAQTAHCEAVQALTDTKDLLLRAEVEAAAAEADAVQRAHDVQAKSSAVEALAAQADEAKKALKHAHKLVDEMRASFLNEAAIVANELRWVLVHRWRSGCATGCLSPHSTHLTLACSHLQPSATSNSACCCLLILLPPSKVKAANKDAFILG